MLIIPGLLIYWGYYCAYKKPGTILLLLDVGRVAILLLLGVGEILFNLHKAILVLKKPALIEGGLSLVTLIYPSLRLYYSCKMIKINEKMQERRIDSPAYIEALSVFSTATNLEELNEQFTKLRNLVDAGSSVQGLAKAYGQQKQKLISMRGIT